MEALTVITRCGDGSCCCIPQRSMIALISIISLVACILHMITTGTNRYPENEVLVCILVECAKQLLISLFQMASLLLLLASIVENAMLVQLYVWYTLTFVVLGFIVNIVDFLFKYKLEGTSCILNFVTEVGFLFAISRCLPLVDTYRKHINGESSITS